ncbi:uncharacterized protein LOC121860820 [Homarus americanus]|uniref:uncharacterized protein LOC121860820 n=1 Tax=Homarus americanus TaxID=6706 RepID=UPI001C43D2F9|nr:uncharacterized protein LOC121860820 [Homarus americanus]
MSGRSLRSYHFGWRGLLLSIIGFIVLASQEVCGSIHTATTSRPSLALHADRDEDTVGGSDEGVDVDPASWSDYLNTLFDPVFDPSVSSNVSAVEGQTAHLVCRVNNLGTKTVSWIRHKDTNILTVGPFTTPAPQCVKYQPPIRAYLITLEVVVPKATILHAPELYTDEGGALNLTCVVSPSPAPPEYIFWYHRGEVINYESDRTVRVSVRQEDGRTVSTLLVARAALDHSGLYQCAPSNTKRASIMVHVFKAEEPAAMQTSSSTLIQHGPSPCLLLPAAVLLRHLLYHGGRVT